MVGDEGWAQQPGEPAQQRRLGVHAPVVGDVDVRTVVPQAPRAAPPEVSPRLECEAVGAWAAANRQTLTDGVLGSLIGVPARGLGHLLDPIQASCVEHEPPPLTALVVSATTGMPGSGFSAASEVPKALQDVFSFNWLEAGGAPSAEAFEASIEQRNRG